MVAWLRASIGGFGISYAELYSESEFILVTVAPDSNPARVAVAREALSEVMQEDPRPPELLLELMAQRAVRRMPLPNDHDIRRITTFNLSLVWPK